MVTKSTQDSINKTIWRTCDIFRNAIDPNQYKDYILTIFFLKYVSDVNNLKYNEYLKRYEGNEERARRAMRHERFIVPQNSSFDYLYQHRNENNIGELIDFALAELKKFNREKFSSEDGISIFNNISFNSNNLGEAKERNARIKSLLIDFSDINLLFDQSHAGNNDTAGNTFIHLIEHFANETGKRTGNFVTPIEVSTLIAKLTKSQPGAKIFDPACGSGSLLIKAGEEVGGENFSLYGQELNDNAWTITMMNMMIHGLDGAIIRWGDTLRNPKLVEGNRLMKFDTIISNPPFSLKNWGADDAIYDQYERFWRGIPPKSKSDWAFISHMLEVAHEEHGKVAVVVPHGALFRGSSERKIRQQTIKENLLEAVIGLPSNMFFGTGIPAVIMIFSKGKKTNHILFIDASQEYENGKGKNKLRNKDIDHIVSTYQMFITGHLEPGIIENKYAYVATRTEIAENEYNLNIPDYIETYEEEKVINIAAVKEEISSLETELIKVQNKIETYLKELEG